jgi:hypothetical protein
LLRATGPGLRRSPFHEHATGSSQITEHDLAISFVLDPLLAKSDGSIALSSAVTVVL